MPVNRAKKKRIARRRRILTFSLLSLLLALILFAISAAGVLVALHIPDIKAMFAKGYTFRFYTAESPNSSQLRQSFDADFIRRQDSLYLDFSALSELCGFAVSGDANQRRYLLGGQEGDTLTVDLGTTSVNLSGQPVAMRAPSFLADDGSLYLPCEFVDSYFNGITVEIDEDQHSVKVTYDNQSDFTLTLHKNEECQEVAPPDVLPPISGGSGEGEGEGGSD